MSKLHTENIPFYTRDLSALDLRIAGIGLRTKPDTKGQLYNPPWIPEITPSNSSLTLVKCPGLAPALEAGHTLTPALFLVFFLQPRLSLPSWVQVAPGWGIFTIYNGFFSPHLFSGRTMGSPLHPSGRRPLRCPQSLFLFGFLTEL